LVRFHNRDDKFDEMPRKLNFTENLPPFEKYQKIPTLIVLPSLIKPSLEESLAFFTEAKTHSMAPGLFS